MQGAVRNLPAMADDHETGAWGAKDGRAWRIGAEADVAWIRENIEVSCAITSAIPPVFEAYATLELPGSGDHRLSAASPLEDPDRHTAGMLAVLNEHSAGQLWWIGYLDTGGADIIFCDVPKVKPGPTEDAGTYWSRPVRSRRVLGARVSIGRAPFPI